MKEQKLERLKNQTWDLLYKGIASVEKRCISLLFNDFDYIRKLPDSGPFPIAYIPRFAEVLVTSELEETFERLQILWSQRVRIAGTKDVHNLREIFLSYIKDFPQAFWQIPFSSHFYRVAKVTKAIAYEMGFEGDGLRICYVGGLLHDVGKFFVDHWFCRPNVKKLELGWDVAKVFVQLHPTMGALLLETVSPLMDGVLPFVRDHQESPNGTGYPQGLKRDEISVEGQMAGLADSYDAKMTRWNSYDNRDSPPTEQEVIDEFSHVYRQAAYENSPVLRAFFEVVKKKHKEFYPQHPS